MSAPDHIADMIGAMEAAGVGPAEPIASGLASGKLIRFNVKGDRPGRRNGWAVLHLDGRPAGAFGSYKAGVSERWRAGATERLSPVERRERRLAWEKVRADRNAAIAREWDSTAARATALHAAAGEPDPAHPYLVKKRITGEGMRQAGDALLVPMRDELGRVWNVQRIFANGDKRFLKGGRITGLYWLCGEPDAALCIGEGVGTMARVRGATGHAVVAAFAEKNLEPVSRLVAAQYPGLDLIVCADDDAHLVDHPNIKRNVGLDAAHAAAAAVGARVAVPPRSAA
jgi:putative DNA primase/helicase